MIQVCVSTFLQIYFYRFKYSKRAPGARNDTNVFLHIIISAFWETLFPKVSFLVLGKAQTKSICFHLGNSHTQCVESSSKERRKDFFALGESWLVFKWLHVSLWLMAGKFICHLLSSLPSSFWPFVSVFSPPFYFRLSPYLSLSPPLLCSPSPWVLAWS